MHAEIRRGDIYFADLDPAFGCEQGGTRPVLIVQNNIGNAHSATTIVAAITRKNRPSLPTHVMLCGVANIAENSVVLLEQLRTIDETRLANKVCSLTDRQMHFVDVALMASLGIRMAPRDTMLMTLCRTCAQSFRDSNCYALRQINPHQDTKELCTVCSTHAGYDFEVTRL